MSTKDEILLLETCQNDDKIERDIHILINDNDNADLNMKEIEVTVDKQLSVTSPLCLILLDYCVLAQINQSRSKSKEKAETEIEIDNTEKRSENQGLEETNTVETSQPKNSEEHLKYAVKLLNKNSNSNSNQDLKLSNNLLLFLTRLCDSIVRDHTGFGGQNKIVSHSVEERNNFQSFVMNSATTTQSEVKSNSNHNNTNNKNKNDCNSTDDSFDNKNITATGTSSSGSASNSNSNSNSSSSSNSRSRVKSSPSFENGISVLEFFSGIG